MVRTVRHDRYVIFFAINRFERRNQWRSHSLVHVIWNIY
jgi:hypothetical protein